MLIDSRFCLVWAGEGPSVGLALLHSYFSYFPWLCGILRSQSHVLSIISCCSHVLILSPHLFIVDVFVTFGVVFDPVVRRVCVHHVHFVIFIRTHRISWYLFALFSCIYFFKLHNQALCVSCYRLLVCFSQELNPCWLIDLWLVAQQQEQEFLILCSLDSSLCLSDWAWNRQYGVGYQSLALLAT